MDSKLGLNDDDVNNNKNNSTFECTVKGRKIGPIQKAPVIMLTLNGIIKVNGKEKLKKKNLVDCYSEFFDGVLERSLGSDGPVSMHYLPIEILNYLSSQAFRLSVGNTCYSTFGLRMKDW